MKGATSQTDLPQALRPCTTIYGAEDQIRGRRNGKDISKEEKTDAQRKEALYAIVA